MNRRIRISWGFLLAFCLGCERGPEIASPGKNSIRITTRGDATEAADGTPIPARRETVPARYNSDSTLEFTVEAGKKNIANFDLDSKGPLPAADTY